MSTLYTIYVTNNSTAFENFSIFQSQPDLSNLNGVNLAWLAKTGAPGEDLSFDLSDPPAPKDKLLETQPKCWLACGKLEPGTVTDPTQMTDPIEVVFPPGVHAMHVTLNPDSSWTVEPEFN